VLYIDVDTKGEQSEFWKAFNRAFNFIKENWKNSIAVTLAFTALVGEAYIIIQAYEEGKAVCSETNDEGLRRNRCSYFFWLALGTVVACGNNLIIPVLATFKNAYLKTNREKNTKWLWPLLAAYVCMMGLMAGVLPAALKRCDGPSAFAVVSILSVYFQSILWAVILGWRDVEKPYKPGGSNPINPIPSAPPPQPSPANITAQAPTITPQQPRAQFIPVN
jgi:hypothetical protein